MSERGKAMIQIQRPMGDDPGMAEWSDYLVDGNTVTLVDTHGEPWPRAKGTWSRKLREGESPDRAAQDLLWARYRAGKRGSDFSRPLVYPKWGIV